MTTLSPKMNPHFSPPPPPKLLPCNFFPPLLWLGQEEVRRFWEGFQFGTRHTAPVCFTAKTRMSLQFRHCEDLCSILIVAAVSQWVRLIYKFYSEQSSFFKRPIETALNGLLSLTWELMGGKKVADLWGLLEVEENVIYLNVKDVMKYSIYPRCSCSQWMRAAEHCLCSQTVQGPGGWHMEMSFLQASFLYIVAYEQLAFGVQWENRPWQKVSNGFFPPLFQWSNKRLAGLEGQGLVLVVSSACVLYCVTS